MVVVKKLQTAWQEFSRWPAKAKLPIYAALGYFVLVALRYL